MLSPQGWTHLPLSKHHYAEELARCGATVYFAGPPEAGVGWKIGAEELRPGLHLVRHRWPVPMALRFHARSLFDAAMRIHARRLGQLAGGAGGAPDVVWCFEPNLYADLRAFRGHHTIFHPVDPFRKRGHARVASTADLVLSVSEAILELFRPGGVPCHLINHGLSAPFEALARRPASVRTSGPVQVGYAGNLLHPHLNAAVVRALVEAHRDVAFHFWGPDKPRAGVYDALPEALAFLAWLRAQPNVSLHGPLPPAQLAEAFRRMDLFLLTYAAGPSYDKSNSHKLLEYLASGRVVVSSRILHYVDRTDLLVMADDADDFTLPDRFAWALAHLDMLNAPEAQERRRAFALANTYARHVGAIERLVFRAPCLA